MVTTPAIVVLLGLLAQANGQINCGQEAVDLCIIIDESSSVGVNNFNIAKQFVADVVTGATIAADRVQVSVITFSTGANIDINFDDYSNDAAGLQNAINGLVYASGGGTDTVAALNLASNTVFTPNRRGERPGARNVVIILTDGMASNAAFLLNIAIGTIQTRGEVFSVGVGSAITLSELQNIASDPDAEHVYRVATFEMLMSIVDSLFTSLCPPCPGGGCSGSQICDRPSGTCVTPMDECTLGTDNCDPNAFCQDTPVAFECMCNSPLIGDGTVGNCNAPNPCTLNTDNCDGNATCTPTASGFSCACNDGFIGDGAEGGCAVDPCSGNDCDGDATCTPFENGSFNCVCTDGFFGNGTTCTGDTSESSLTNNCDVNANCSRNMDSFFCTCNDGFFGKSTMANCMVCP